MKMLLSYSFFVVSSFLSLLSYSFCLKSSREMEGYAVGYLSDCPGSTKPSVLSKKVLKKLTFSVADTRNPNVFGRRKSYNYYQMKLLAKDPSLNFKKKTLLFASGYMDTPDFVPAMTIRDHYLKWNYNVLLLDTNRFTTYHYARASRIVPAVGKKVAEMLSELVNEGLDPLKLEILGLSLGCQTASFIGKHFQQITGRNISRITALDPAGPCFRHLGPSERLDSSDAEFVDVISTNVDGFGMAAPVGHVNFYVNGGEYQPGEFKFLWEYCDVLCSHVRSLFIWISALENPGKFIGMPCDSVQQARDNDCYDRTSTVTNVLGLDTKRDVHGIFYLATAVGYPYYLGEEGLKKKNMVWNKMLGLDNNDDEVVL